MLFRVSTIVTGCVGNSMITTSTGFDYADVVLENVGNLMALRLTKAAVDFSGGLSAVIDAGATLFCGWIAAAFVLAEP